MAILTWGWLGCALVDPSSSETFTLTHVRGMPVPATFFFHQGYRSEIVEGTIRLGPLHRFAQDIRVRQTDNGIIVVDTIISTFGRYSRRGTTLKVVYLEVPPGNLGRPGHLGKTYVLEAAGNRLIGFEALSGVDLGNFGYDRR